MAVPKRKTSKAKGRSRRAHWRVHPANLVPCTHCGVYIQPHRVCHACGYYKGHEVLNLVAKPPGGRTPKKKDKSA